MLSETPVDTSAQPPNPPRVANPNPNTLSDPVLQEVFQGSSVIPEIAKESHIATAATAPSINTELNEVMMGETSHTQNKLPMGKHREEELRHLEAISAVQGGRWIEEAELKKVPKDGFGNLKRQEDQPEVKAAMEKLHQPEVQEKMNKMEAARHHNALHW